MNLSINKASKQVINQSINQSISQSVNQSIMHHHSHHFYLPSDFGVAYAANNSEHLTIR